MELTSVALVGGGFVGTATARALQANGHDVIVCDIKRSRRRALRRDYGIVAVSPEGMLGKLAELDVVRIAVPSNNGTDGRYDVMHVESALKLLAEQLAVVRRKRPLLVLMGSTLDPEQAYQVMTWSLEHPNLIHGEDYLVGSYPEFLRVENRTPEETMDDVINARLAVMGLPDWYDLEQAGFARSLFRRLHHWMPSERLYFTTFGGAVAGKLLANNLNMARIATGNQAYVLSFLNELDESSAGKLLRETARDSTLWRRRLRGESVDELVEAGHEQALTFKRWALYHQVERDLLLPLRHIANSTWVDPEPQLDLRSLIVATTNYCMVAVIDEYCELMLACGLSDRDVAEAMHIAGVAAESCYNELYGTKNLGAAGGVCLTKDPEATRALGFEHRLLCSMMWALTCLNSMVWTVLDAPPTSELDPGVELGLRSTHPMFQVPTPIKVEVEKSTRLVGI